MGQRTNEGREFNVSGFLCGWSLFMREVSWVYRFPMGLGVSAGLVTGSPGAGLGKGGTAKPCSSPGSLTLQDTVLLTV